MWMHCSVNALFTLLFCLIKKIKEEGDEPYVSIVGGSGEYSSAAITISMTEGGVVILGANITDERIEVINEDDSRDYYNHIVTSCIKINQIDLTGPNDVLLTDLSILDRMPEQRRTSSNVIREMIEDGIWYRIKTIGTPTHKYEFTSMDPDIKAGKNKRGKKRNEKEMRSDLKSNEKNKYQRQLIAKWKNLEWIEEDSRTVANYSITEKGRSLLHIYKTPIDFEGVLRHIKDLDIEFEQVESSTPVRTVVLD